jgi:hypothetical protein
MSDQSNTRLCYPLFKIGDKVEVIKYGHLMFINKKHYLETQKSLYEIGNKKTELELKWIFGQNTTYTPPPFTAKNKPDNIISETDTLWWVDMQPELVGKKGIISNISNRQGYSIYSIKGIKGKNSWYDEEQLKRIK